MSDPWSLSITTSEARHRGQTHGRPSHLSVGSLVTNASGLAESTISQGTAWTGESADTAVRISQFPAPPTELPTPTSPTRSAFSSPRSTATSLRKSLPSSLTLSSHLPSPTSPSSQVDPTYRGSPVPSHSSNFSMASGTASFSQATVYEQTAPLKLHKRSAYTSHTPTGSPVSPDKGQSNVLPIPPPIREEPSVPVTPRRPPSPSTLAGSSMYDWTDGMSGISVNTGEERLLSTSFITSLLAQTPDPFASVRPPTAWNRHGTSRHHKVTYSSSEGTAVEEQSNAATGGHGITPIDHTQPREPYSHQSVPQSIHSSEVYMHSAKPSDASGPPIQHGRLENASIITGSVRTSGDYSETLHSEEQVQSLVRSPSVVAKGKATRAVGITPAYRVSYVGGESKGLSDSAGNSIMTASSTISPLPPVHRADVPMSVMAHHKFFDADNIPRESEEDFGRKMGSMSLDMEGYDLGQSLDLPNSPALPSTAGTESRFTDAQTDSRRQSRRQLSRNQSMRSVVSSLVSRISNNSSARRAKYMAWLKKRPLPPLPSSMPRTLPVDPHNAEIQKYEEDIPLPTLAKRAAALGEMLDDGEVFGQVHQRPNSQFYKELRVDNPTRQSHFSVRQDGSKDVDEGAGGDSKEHTERKGVKSWFGGTGGNFTTTSTSRPTLSLFKRTGRFRVIIVACLVFGIVLAIAVPVGVTRHKKSSSSTLPSCPGNMTGTNCNLDATCVCTATSETCKPLAKSLLNLVPTVNSFFAANFTGSSMSDAIFNAQGATQGSSCARQAMLVDVAPGLQQSQFPNRTLWSQSVILWNLGMSQDLNATTVLQTFVAKQAPWSSLSSNDGVVPDASGTFAVTASGLIFDFAAQTISPVPTTFRNEANPTAAQLSELTASNTQILDRMYSFAKASSLQRQRALNNYWTTTLQQQMTDLSRFIAAVTSSPFLLPFDATSSNISTLMTNSTSAQFPPPLACYPSMSSSQLSRLNAIEVSVFGLSPATVPARFDTSCFPTRPVYGVVDLLRLRLPFTDDRQGVGKQATLLSGDAQKRAVLYSGEILSALPGASTVPGLTNASTDPREYGTSDNINHVLLNYLSSISDVTLAMELVQFVLSGSSTPPPSSSPLSSALSALPVLEFAVFGSITPPDLLSSVSSFSAPDGSLFFGSDAGQTFRTWALVQSTESVAWTQSATASTIVHEGASVNSVFESVWTPASQLVHAGTTDASDVGKVTQSLQSLGLFSSS